MGYSYEGHTCGRGTNCPISPSAEGFPQDAGLAVPGRLEQLVTLPLSLPQYLILATSRKARKASLKFVYFAFQIPLFQTVKHPELSAEEIITKGQPMLQGDRAVPATVP